MGPSNRSRLAGKKFSRFLDAGYCVDVKSVKKSKYKKKMLPDMSISHWSNIELERFYEAYRLYTRNWKKVAAKVRSKTPHESEMLFNMCKSYLSLPDGEATAAGLIALTIDRYNAMEEGNSDPDRKQVDVTYENPRKRSRVKSHIESSKGSEEYVMLQNQSTHPGLSCLSLLNRDNFGGNQARAVRKRTPRYPVSSFAERNTIENVRLPIPDDFASTSEDSTEKGIHVAALALARASQMGCLHELSTLGKRSEKFVGYHGSRGELKLDGVPPDARVVDVEAQSIAAGEDDQSDNQVHDRTENQTRMGKLQNRPEILVVANHNFNDLPEAYSRSEWVDMVGGKRKMEMEITEAEAPLGEQAESEPVQIFSADEESALHALQALSGLELGNGQSKKSFELGSCISAGENTLSEANRKSYISGSRTKRRKQNPTEEKVHNILKAGTKKEMLSDEILVEEANKTCASKLFPLTDQGKVIQGLELASSSIDAGIATTNSATLSKSALVSDSRDMPISRRKKHKLYLQKEMSRRNLHSHHLLGDGLDCSQSQSVRTDLSNLEKGKLSNCLSSRILRRWCTFEWFYSSIDYPWFARLDFVEYLNHVRLGHVPRLTQVEWSIIRSSLGKPRRLSQKYLVEERKKLEQYRESVRTHYAELRAGLREGIATDLAKPLAVGQRVIARHPKTREIQDGKVLTIDRDRYRVQFDRTELGVELVMDTDCTSSNPWENLPDDLRRQNALNRLCHSFNADGCIFELNNHRFSVGSGKNTSFTGASKPSVPTKIQEREDNIIGHDKLSQAYKKREALEIELRQMKEAASLKQKCGIESEQFRKQYAMVLLQLREANLEFGSALLEFRTSSAYDIDNHSESHVVEIVESLRHKAKNMVDGAMQEMCSIDLGKDAPSCTEVTSAGNQLYRSKSCQAEKRSVQFSVTANSETEDETTLCVMDTATSHNPICTIKTLDVDTSQMLSELISASVSTLLMIQVCTERQYPPAEVAEILDCAVMRLQPRCSKNLPIYREIETCIGMIKSQMLALIPTQSS